VSTVLIASPDLLPALKDRIDLVQATAFTDAEALKALETITRERPQVVALEKLFAATSRGTALINRIKADPGLAACEIRIVTHEAVTAPSAASATLAATLDLGPASAALAAPAPLAPLDQRGTRRAPRTKVIENVEVMIDGNPATLVDISVIGVQVVSVTILKPNQRVRISLPDPSRPLRISAGVAWASFEMPKGGPRYRAGIEFFDAEADAVSAWMAKVART
jgi:hypothetical protein